MSDPTGAEIGRAFQQGQPEAVQRVRERVGRIVSFRRYSMSDEDRKDVCQEIMTDLWRATNRSSFTADDRFWGLVEVVAARRCIDWLRAQRNERVLDFDIEDVGTNPLASALQSERLATARSALARLPEPCRELLDLHLAQGMSYKEIALRLGKREGALRVQVFRCIRQARRILDRIEASATSGDSPIAKA